MTALECRSGRKADIRCLSFMASLGLIHVVKNLPAVGRCDAQKDFALASASTLNSPQCSLPSVLKLDESHYRSDVPEASLANRKYRKDVTVRIIVRAVDTPPNPLSEVPSASEDLRWELASLRITRIERQFGSYDWDVHDDQCQSRCRSECRRVISVYGEAFRSACAPYHVSCGETDYLPRNRKPKSFDII